MAHGALEYVSGKKDNALNAFSAASTLNPGMWVMAYGDRVRMVYENAAVGTSGNGTIALEPAPPGELTEWVDGEPVEMPADVAAGLHLLQVVDDNETVFHKLVMVPEDSTETVEYVPPEPKKTKKPKPGKVKGSKYQQEPRKSRPPLFLYGAIGSAAISGATAGAALAQNGIMNEADEVDDVEAAYARQVGFAATSYTFAGLAATGLVLHVAL